VSGVNMGRDVVLGEEMMEMAAKAAVFTDGVAVAGPRSFGRRGGDGAAGGFAVGGAAGG
jgi:hypothetical protein